jgi:RNA polymerase sigma-70 factor (ECF subfamily)
MSDDAERDGGPYDPTAELALHERLLRGEGSATWDLTRRFFERLARQLRVTFPSVRDDTDLQDCALQALLEYFRDPGRFSPERGSLWTLLWVTAYRRALNLLKRLGREPQLLLELDSERVAGEDAEWNSSMKRLFELLPGLPEGVTVAELQAEVVARLRPEDRPVLPLILSAEEDPEVYARVLKLEHLPEEARLREVAKAKDRVWAALRRTRQRYRDDRRT